MSYEYGGCAFNTMRYALRALAADIIGTEEIVDSGTHAEMIVNEYMQMVENCHSPTEYTSFKIIGTDEREDFTKEELLLAARRYVEEITYIESNR